MMWIFLLLDTINNAKSSLALLCFNIGHINFWCWFSSFSWIKQSSHAIFFESYLKSRKRIASTVLTSRPNCSNTFNTCLLISGRPLSNKLQLVLRLGVNVTFLQKSMSAVKANLDSGKFNLESWHHENQYNQMLSRDSSFSSTKKEITLNFVVRRCSKNFQARFLLV